MNLKHVVIGIFVCVWFSALTSFSRAEAAEGDQAEVVKRAKQASAYLYADDCPAESTDKKVSMIISIKDASEQQIYHNFTLNVE